MKLLIAEDIKMIMDALVGWFDSDEEFEIVAKCGTTKELLASYKELKPEVLLLDLMLNGQNCIDAIRYIRAVDENVKIVLITAEKAKVFEREAEKLKINAFVRKQDVSAEELKAIVKSVASNNGSHYKVAFGKEHITLTPRRQQVLSLVAEGKTSNEIAEIMFISVQTVKEYFKNIKKALNAVNLANAVCIGHRSGEI